MEMGILRERLEVGVLGRVYNRMDTGRMRYKGLQKGMRVHQRQILHTPLELLIQ